MRGFTDRGGRPYAACPSRHPGARSAGFGRLVRLIVDDTGQDLIEYALLTGIIGIAGLLVFPQLVEQMTAAYTNTVTETESLWVPCPPGGCP